MDTPSKVMLVKHIIPAFRSPLQNVIELFKEDWDAIFKSYLNVQGICQLVFEKQHEKAFKTIYDKYFFFPPFIPCS